MFEARHVSLHLVQIVAARLGITLDNFPKIGMFSLWLPALEASNVLAALKQTAVDILESEIPR